MLSRFISPGMVSTSAPRRVIVGSPRCFLAASIATALKSRATDSKGSSLHEIALATQSSLAPRLGIDERRLLISLAGGIVRESKCVPNEDRVAVLACIVRELLVDGPDSCEDLDRAVRDACEKRYGATEAHVKCAERIAEKMMR